MTATQRLVTIELRFVSREDPEQVADRIRESVAAIVGRESLEFRVRTMPLEPPDGERGRLRPIE